MITVSGLSISKFDKPHNFPSPSAFFADTVRIVSYCSSIMLFIFNLRRKKKNGSDTSEHIHSESWADILVYNTYAHLTLLTWGRFEYGRPYSLITRNYNLCQLFIHAITNPCRLIHLAHTYICSNIFEPRWADCVGTNEVYFGSMLQLNCPTNTAPTPTPLQDNVPGSPWSFMALSWRLVCTGRSQLGRCHVFTCTLMTGLEKGPLDAGIGPAQYCRFPNLIPPFLLIF
jgi:hypothetical protein